MRALTATASVAMASVYSALARWNAACAAAVAAASTAFSPIPPGINVAKKGAGSTLIANEIQRLRSVRPSLETRSVTDIHVFDTSAREAKRRSPIDLARSHSAAVSSAARAAMAAARMETAGQSRKYSAETRTAAFGIRCSSSAGASSAKAEAEAETPAQSGSTALVRSAAASCASASAAACIAVAATSLPPETATLPTYSKVSPSAAARAAIDGMSTSTTRSVKKMGEVKEMNVMAVSTRISVSVSLRFSPARKSRSSRSPLSRLRLFCTVRCCDASSFETME
mmetsp:Transcript_32937/g.81874  ORF Transcript_32937/g.81874 Transcript_32937/m.81874 type:complete len:284 (-) Transcript_32937:422-1273(-)